MLKRKIINELVKWKQDKNKKALILEGMRQVGKTYIINYFAKQNYKNVININFLLNDKYKQIFADDLSTSTILEKIKLFNEFKDVDFNDYLIILDEIQACPNALTALKSFTIDNIDVIATGSYLGTKYKQVNSYPVGYVQYLELYPLDFEEFLWANDISKEKIEYLKKSFINKTQIDSIVHNEMIELFRKYIIVGGMPEVVKTYVEQHDFYQARKIQNNIINSFYYDVSKYASINETQKIIETFNSIVVQLSKENKKFMFSKINKNARSKWYYSALSWLIDANIVNKCVLINNLMNPLNAYEDIDNFKIYMNDTGLLCSLIDSTIINQIILDQDCIYKGAIYENIISQVFKTNGYKLRYFKRKETLEIDFVINQHDDIVPIEVKAGNNRSKSLLTIINENNHLKGIKLTNNNIKVTNRIIHLPWYLAWLI